MPHDQKYNLQLGKAQFENAHFKEDFNDINQWGEFLSSQQPLMSLAEITSPSVAPPPILGNSVAIKKVKDQIRKAAKSQFPVIIYGEPGCEKFTVAMNIHASELSRPGEFIEVSAQINSDKRFQRNLAYALMAAKDGTLYLSNLEYLNKEKLDILITLFTLKGLGDQLKSNNIRLILSSIEDLNYRVNNKFSSSLSLYLPHILDIYIPPLKQRSHDINIHVKYYIESNSQGISPTSISVDAVKLLSNKQWPGNSQELERYIVRLITFCDKQHIGCNEITAFDPTLKKQEKKDNNIAISIINGDIDKFEHTHLSVKKAIEYISYNYHREITLNELAESSFVSASHLSFLFRSILKRSFKQLLTEVRIEKAKSIINNKPLSKITDVAYSVGFGDLSHFEKKFKHLTKLTPRQYRDRCRKENKLIE